MTSHALEKWTSDEVNRLVELLQSGVSADASASILGRGRNETRCMRQVLIFGGHL